MAQILKTKLDCKLLLDFKVLRKFSLLTYSLLQTNKTKTKPLADNGDRRQSCRFPLVFALNS